MRTSLVRRFFILIALAISSVACSSGSTPTLVSSPTGVSTPTLTLTPTATQTFTPSPVPSPTKIVSPTPGPRENLLTAYDAALAKIKVYRVEVVLNPSRQDDPERIIEVILPDRFRQIQDTEIRQIGNRVYFFEPVPYSGTSTGLMPAFQRVHLPWYRDQFAQAAQTAFLGRSTVIVHNAQIQVVGYQSTIKVMGTNISDPKTFGKSIDQPIKVWFSASNGFPVRMEVGQPLVYINGYFDINGKIDDIGPP